MSDAGDPKAPAGPMTASEAEAEAADEAATEVAEAEAADASHEGDHGPGAGHEGAHHDAGHGGHDGHGEGEALGPIDVKAWAASLIGVVAAAVVIAALGVANGLI